MPDIAGNSLATATSINITSVVQSFPDLVTPTANDFYRFNLASGGGLNLSLTGLDADANVELLDASGNPVLVNGAPLRSGNTGTLSESINAVLNPGTYVIRVSPAASVALANYTLNVSRGDVPVATSILWNNPVLARTDSWVMNGAVSVGSVPISPQLGGGWFVGGLGDFNGDGQSDILWRRTTSATEGRVGLWLMDGTNRLATVSLDQFSVGANWDIGGTGDFNGDGQTDILWRNSAQQRTEVWLMRGTNFLSAVPLVATSPGSAWEVDGVADFNRDNRPDIIWRNSSQERTDIWLMNGLSSVSSVALPTVSSAWRAGGAADFNGDGNVDILWREYGGQGRNSIWLMNGTASVGSVALRSISDPNWAPLTPFNRRDGQAAEVDAAGNTLATAFDLGDRLTGQGTFRGSVAGATDPNDFFRLNLATPSRINVGLSGLSANLDLQLLDSTGAVIQTSALPGLATEGITRELAAGTYFLRVFPNGAGDRSSYNLGVSINNLPVVVNNFPLSLNEQGSATIGAAQLSATDPDNSAAQLTYTLSALPSRGTLSVNGAAALVGSTFTQADLAAGNRLSYSHDGSETTSDSFTFNLSDGAGGVLTGSTFSINVTPVNDAPVITLPTGVQAIDQGANTLIPSIQISDPDAGTGDVIVTLTAAEGLLTLGRRTNPGITLLTGDGENESSISFRGRLDVVNFVLQSLLYRSGASFQGPDTITVEVNDNGNTGLGGAQRDTETLSLLIAPVNDPPVLSVPGGQTVSEDIAALISGISVDDPDAAAGAMTVVVSVANGTVTLGSTAGLTFTTGTGSRDKVVVFRGALSAINGALSGLRYLGDQDYTGADLISIEVSDNGNTGNGVALSDRRTIAVTVNPRNDAPVITAPASQTVAENVPLLIQGVSVRDVDSGTADLTVSLFAGNGQLSLASTSGLTFSDGDGTDDGTMVFTGSQAAINEALTRLTYRGLTNFNGADTVSVSVSDGGNTGAGIILSDTEVIAINVLGVNNPPLITIPNDRPTVDSDTNLTLTGISVSDPDVGGGNLSVTIKAESGIVTLSSTAGLTFSQGDGRQDNRITFTGNLSAINAALSQLTYRSYPGVVNVFDRITISVNDNGNTGTIGVSASDTKAIIISVGNAVNQPPVARGDSFGLIENGTLSASSILTNDTDPDFTEPLTAQLVAGPTSAATFTLNPNGTFNYTPNRSFNGTDSFTYVAVDALGGASNTATVLINVSAVNDIPVAVNDNFGTLRDQPLNGNVLTNDTDIDNPISQLTARLVSGPANSSSFNLNADGSFAYTPRALFFGNDRFTYAVQDPSGAFSNTATVSITVGFVNTAPVAGNDGPFTVAAGGALSVTGRGVLVNDTDADTTNLSAILETQAANGTVTLNNNGSFVYRPTGAFSGTDSFTYRASDGSLSSNLATVTISVGNNRPPVATGDRFTLGEDGTITAGNLLANDSDPDGNLPLAASIVTQPASGTVSLNADNTFSYVPPAEFSGVTSFTYVAIDSLGAVSAPVDVTLTVTAVNDAPVAVNDTLSVSPGATLNLTAPGVLANDTDIDSPVAALSVTRVNDVVNGTLSLQSNGSFTYRPNTGFSGVDSFTYRASDGSLSSNLATVTIVVDSSANNRPIAQNDSFSLNRNTLLTGGNILANDSDPDSNPFTASIVAAPSGALSFSVAPDGSLTYQPAAGFVGVETFTYVAVDSLGGVSDLATVTLSVTATNTAPVAVNDDGYRISQTGTLAISAPGVLANDTDAETPTASLSVLTTATAANGTLSLQADGSFTYRPNAGFSGTDSFTYRVSDGSLTSNLATATITVTVPLPNTAPIASDDTYSVRPTETLTISLPSRGVLGNDRDNENDPLSATVVGTVSNGLLNLSNDGTFIYTPPTGGAESVESFTYQVTDGQLSSTATVTIRVTANPDPIASPDSFTTAEDTPITTGNVLANDDDGSGGTLSLTASLVSGPSNSISFTLNADGSFTYAPATDFNGSDRFVYVAQNSAGLSSNPATVTLSVTPVNDAPRLVTGQTFVVNAGAPSLTITAPGVLTGAIDPEGNPISATIVGQATQGSVTLNPDGSFRYAPSVATAGLDSFTYAASDGSATSETVTVTLRRNAPPVAAGDVYTAVIGAPLTVDVTDGVLINDADADDVALTASIVSQPAQGNVVLGSDGSFVYTPAVGTTANQSFVYRVSDGFATSNLATVTLSLRTNTAPVAVSDQYFAPADNPLTVGTFNGILQNDTDAETPASQLSVISVSGVQAGNTLSLNSDGSFVYTPATGFLGTDSFVYRVSDGLTTSGLATVTLTVVVNSPPTAQDDRYDAFGGATLNVDSPGVGANDSDPDGTSLSYALVSDPAGTLSFGGDGAFTYTPGATFSGVDTFVYRATDGIASSTATVSITVTPNSPPVAAPDRYNAVVGQTLTITAPGVLANDTDVDGNSLSVRGFFVNNGILDLRSDGAFTYLANPGFTGTDFFTYQANDGRVNSNSVTVTITVSPNSAPVAVRDGYTVNRSNSLVVPTTLGVLANDTDANNVAGANVAQPLSATVVTGPTQGSLSFNPNGSFTYVASATASGFDSFTYRVSDGLASALGTATLTIRTTSTPPVANEDGGFTVGQNRTLSVTAAGVLANDTDADGDRLQASVVAGPTLGSVTLNPDGSFVYQANSTTGTDSFTYRATDGLNNSTATVFVTIGGVNTAPTIEVPGTQLVLQSTTLVLSSGLNVVDPDAGASPVRLTLSAANGLLSLGNTLGLSFTTGDGTGDPNMVFSGALSSINNALRNLRFTPSDTFTGLTQITLTADDQGATGTGGPQTGSGTITVNVSPGASLVTNIAPGSASSTPSSLVSFNNTLYFAASNTANGTELWRSDGVTTTRISDINDGGGSASPTNLTVVNNILYFAANDGIDGTELWRADLTAGTAPTLVADLRAGTLGSSPSNLVNLNGVLFFRANDGSGGNSIFRLVTGGTPVELTASPAYTDPANLTVVGTTLYFTANGNSQLWRSDGSTTQQVLGAGTSIANLTAVGNTLFFSASDSAGTELWSSTGTGATRVADLNVGANGSNPTSLVNVGGNLFFFANNGSGFRLYRSTPTGTVTSITTLPAGSGVVPSSITAVGDRLFFVVDAGTTGNPDLQLWSSDGVSTATVVSNLNTATNGNDGVGSLVNFNGSLFFTANDGTGLRVFRSDGTSAGTIPASGIFSNVTTGSLVTSGNQLFFAATDPSNGTELWVIR
jgi:ELWxxDGT repeat protein/VCBS repeat-containing protein